MTNHRTHHSFMELKKIWHQVPLDYYQNGVKKKLLQKLWHTGKLNAIVKLIEKNNAYPQNILDVGCASGWFLSRIHKRYPKADCSGIDVYKKAVEYGKKKYLKLKLFYGDAHKMPFENNSFDIVICTEVLEHVVSPEKVLKEIERVLTKDGIAIIEMDTGNFLFKAAWYWWTNLRRGVWRDSHIHAFNAEKLEKMIKNNGFSIVKRKLFNCTMGVAFLVRK